jgi:FlaA1/EpsC-like NDP-sugar epimerase
MHRLLVNTRLWIIVAVQVIIIVSSLVLAFALRFDMTIPERYWPTLKVLLPVLLAIKLLVFWGKGLLKGWWRYASMADLIIIVKANLIASAGVVIYAFC